MPNVPNFPTPSDSDEEDRNEENRPSESIVDRIIDGGFPSPSGG
jgi:hypothetical protein